MSTEIPKVIKFLRLELPKEVDILTIEDYKKFLNEFLIPFQGEDVMLIEDKDISIGKYLILFEALNIIAASVALEDINKEKFLIFDHNFQDTYYLEDVNSKFKNLSFETDKPPVEVLELDLENIYAINKNIEESLEAIKNIVAPAQIGVLKGKTPLLLFLLITYGVKPLVAELYYETLTELIKIF